MASIHRHPNSKFWYCCINIPGRGQLQRTTKHTDRRKAYDFAQKLESASRGNALTDIQARKILAEIYAIRNPGEQLPGSSAREFFNSWASNKKRETADATGVRYTRAIDSFVASLGKRADIDISAIAPKDILQFRDHLASRLSTSTANHAVKVVRMALKDAQAAGLVTANVAIGVRAAKSARDSGGRRRPFTLPEISRLLREAHGEWTGLILFGLYTGQRLGDIARLTWQNVDLARGELALVSRKTNRRQLIPIAAPLQKFLENSDAGDDPKQSLFPKAAAAKRISTLSNQFYDVMANAGLVESRKHKSNGKGRSSRRAFNELSFHALRHTATSLMKNAGISPAIVQDIIGHDSPEMSAHYTRIEESAKRRAIEALPDVTQPPR
ncbi:MAG: tyrosine-type recombinase/integrase [Candidatus Udaeobacter sp.]